jgi:GT2 family glycosyltransferase
LTHPEGDFDRTPHSVQPLVYVLLLNWNSWEYTTECLASLQNLEYGNWKVLVIDNGSTDGSPQRIREHFAETEVLELGANLGFARGNNAGIPLALQRGADYVWLLNNDATADPAALRAMVEKAEEDPRVGAVGSAIYGMSNPERLQAWGGGHINFWLGRGRHFLKPVADEKLDFITGASLLLKQDVLESIGLLDEGFFLYWEDSDYCFRMRRAGWRLAVAADSKVWHEESATIRKNPARLDMYFNRSAVRFFERNSRFPLVSIWVGVALRMAKRALRADFARVRAVWAGVKG